MNDDLISREELLFAIRQQLAFQKEKAELTTIDADKMSHSLVATGIQLAIDIIDNAPTVPPEYFPPCEDCNKKMEEIRQAYDKMKVMERPQSAWIPVSERLPEEKINPKTNDLEEVLCTTIWGDVRHYKYGKPIGYDEAHFWYGWGIMDKDVIAWQPLPEPYKEGEEK